MAHVFVCALHTITFAQHSSSRHTSLGKCLSKYDSTVWNNTFGTQCCENQVIKWLTATDTYIVCVWSNNCMLAQKSDKFLRRRLHVYPFQDDFKTPVKSKFSSKQRHLKKFGTEVNVNFIQRNTCSGLLSSENTCVPLSFSSRSYVHELQKNGKSITEACSQTPVGFYQNKFERAVQPYIHLICVNINMICLEHTMPHGSAKLIFWFR